MAGDPMAGGVFSKRLPGGRAGASVGVDDRGVIAHTRAGDTFTIPLGECQLERGGASGKMISCRNAARTVTIFSEDRGFLTALAARSELANQVEALRTAGRRARQRAWLWAGALLTAFVLLCFGGYFAVRYAAARAATSLPTSVDERIGHIARGAMVDPGARLDDPVVEDAIERLVERLEPHAEALAGTNFTYDVAVVRGPEVNAFALPGGPIVVYTGLIEHAEHPDEVAGVLAHEMAHVTRRHGLKRIGQSLGVVAAIELIIGDVSGLVGAAIEVLEVAAVSSYGRDQEAQADADAVRVLHAAGLDASALRRFFARLAAEQGDIPAVLAWQASHPRHAERIAALEALEQDLGPNTPAPLALGWDTIQARATSETAAE